MVSLNFKQICVTVGVFGLSACAPLQQAPLVYSSKVVVGVDISGTTTEQPGVSINVGYKQVDAAYVPVAVAKPCEQRDKFKRSDCKDKTYQLQEITGRNTVGDSEVPKSALEAAQKRLNDFKQLSQASDDAEAELAKARLSYDEARLQMEAFESQNRIQLQNADFKNEVDRTPEERLLLGERQIKKSKVNKEEGTVKIAEATKAKASDAFRKANVSELAGDLKLVGGKNEKTDAYSVFGSFDANTKAGAEAGGSSAAKGEVALVIGKVFSTGVASQNLTEGMRRYYSGMGSAQTERVKVSCLTVGETYISKYKEALKLDTEEGKRQLAKVIESVIDTCSKTLDEVESKFFAQLKSTKN